MDGKSLLFMNGRGELKAVVADLKSELREHAGQYRILVSSPEMLILRKESPQSSLVEEPERVLMAGEIFSPSTVLEVVNMISSSRWVGTLHLFGSDSHRQLGFDRGMLRYAASDHIEDRLDKVLYRLGALSPSQIESVLREIKPDQRLGELLLQRGLIDHQQLYGFLQGQMEQILLAAVLEREGSYLFSMADESGMPPAATSLIPVQQLLFTAAERLDRLARFEKLIPDLDMCPEVEPGIEVTELDPKSRLFLGYCDGARSLRQIASETWMGRFETVRTAYDLLRLGKIRLRPAQQTAAELAVSLARPFNESLGEIYQAAERQGMLERARAEVLAWLEGSPHRELLGGTLDGGGLIIPNLLAEKLTGSFTRHRMESLYHALHSLASFALFTANLRLPREQERDLSRRVHQRLRSVNL